MFEKKEEKKVEYLELIYDLIFVYLIGRNSSLVQHVEGGFINWNLFLTYTICTFIVIQIWSSTTFYVNRYGTNGIRDHISMLINMYLLYYMAEATRTDWQSYYYRYNAAWGLILLNLAIQYFIQMRKARKTAPWESAHSRFYFIMLTIQAAIVILSIPLYSVTHIPASPLALVFGIVVSVVFGRMHYLVAVDFPHLTERAMLYVVFTFGEMIIAIAGYFSGDFNLNMVYFSLFGFLIVVGLFLSYELFYNDLIDREMHTNGVGYMYIHLVLIFSLNCITMSLEFMAEEKVNVLMKTIFLTAAIVLFYVFLFMLGRYTGKQRRPGASFIIRISLIGASFVALMIIFRNNAYINIAVTAIYVYIVLIVLFDFRRKLNICRNAG